jgi:hypothetical protein
MIHHLEKNFGIKKLMVYGRTSHNTRYTFCPFGTRATFLRYAKSNANFLNYDKKCIDKYGISE